MMKRILRIGTIPDEGSVFVTIEWKDNRLSICGVTGPKANGDARGSCGQNRDDPLRVTDFAKGWSAHKAKRLHELWERWHLNDMTAGSPAQEAWLRKNPVKAVYPESHYEKACAALAEAGLNPDPDYDGYRYGTKWLKEDVPEKVIAELFDLPEADRPLPGCWA